MVKKGLPILLLLALLPASAEASLTPKQAYQLGKDAYVYGLPLLEFSRVREDNLKTQAPVNRLANAQDLAGPEDRQVVLPNTDTLYSLAQLDLKKPLLLKVPQIDNRYWSFQLLDPYTNVSGYVKGRSGTWVLEWNKAKAGRVPSGASRLTVRSRRIWMLGRFEVKGDLAKTKQLMSALKTGPIGGKLQEPVKATPGRPAGRAPQGLQFLKQLRTQMKLNPPPSSDRQTVRRLKAISRPEKLKPEVLGELLGGLNDAEDELPNQTRSQIFSQALQSAGWYIPPDRIGLYGTDYKLRAMIALAGLGANTPDEAMYPVAITDQAGDFLTGERSYRLTLPSPPPVKAFWSLTMYDSAGYLVDNPAGIYAVGSSHPGLKQNPDGSIVIAVQNTKPDDSSLNWLPSPKGPFRLNLRLYLPQPEALSGAWKPPGLITAG